MDRNIEIRANANYPILHERHPENEIKNAQFLAYCKGATEQKAIDIDKACKWIINTYLGDYVTDKYGNGGIGDNVKLAEDFRKAMEE